MDSMDRNKQWFVDNSKELDMKYHGKYVVVSDCEVKEVFECFADAYNFGMEHFGKYNFYTDRVFKFSESSGAVKPVVDVKKIIPCI